MRGYAPLALVGQQIARARDAPCEYAAGMTRRTWTERYGCDRHFVKETSSNSGRHTKRKRVSYDITYDAGSTAVCGYEPVYHRHFHAFSRDRRVV